MFHSPNVAREAWQPSWRPLNPPAMMASRSDGSGCGGSGSSGPTCLMCGYDGRGGSTAKSVPLTASSVRREAATRGGNPAGHVTFRSRLHRDRACVGCPGGYLHHTPNPDFDWQVAFPTFGLSSGRTQRVHLRFVNETTGSLLRQT